MKKRIKVKSGASVRKEMQRLEKQEIMLAFIGLGFGTVVVFSILCVLFYEIVIK